MQTESRDSFIAPWKVYLRGMSRSWLFVRWHGEGVTGCSHGPGKKKFPVSQAGALSPMLGSNGRRCWAGVYQPRMRWHGDEDRCPPEQTRGSTELEKGMGMANSEQKTKDGLGQGGEGGGRQRNRLGRCAELYTAQRAPHLRNHGCAFK